MADVGEWWPYGRWACYRMGIPMVFIMSTSFTQNLDLDGFLAYESYQIYMRMRPKKLERLRKIAERIREEDTLKYEEVFERATQ